MWKKIIFDVIASLLSSYILAVWLDYNFVGSKFEVESLIFGILFGVLALAQIILFYILRKKQSPPLPLLNKIFDIIFPFFLIGTILSFIGMGIYIGDIYDERVGQRIMDSVSNDFTRNFIDIYASGGQGALIVKPLGLLLFLLSTSISRFLGASLKTQKIPKPKV